MRSLRVIYAIALVLATTVFLILTAQFVRQIIPSDRHALEKLSHGLAVLALVTVVVGLGQVLYTRRTHLDKRVYVVFMILVAVYLLIGWAVRP